MSVTVKSATPILFVRDVEAAARFYADTLGFAIDFLHGEPPFYGAVSRGGARLHLRHVDQPNFAMLATTEPSLIAALIEVAGIGALFDELARRGATIAQAPVRHAWGGTDFHVGDPDGNVIAFVEYRREAGRVAPESQTATTN
jgi:uncharacterized glyoxalase superfamily protein PhnB